MKPTTTAALIGTSLTLAVALFLSSFLPHGSKAAGVPGGEQYKVISVATVQSPQQLEQQLNQLGADGWKVRTSIGAFVVLEK